MLAAGAEIFGISFPTIEAQLHQKRFAAFRPSYTNGLPAPEISENSLGENVDWDLKGLTFSEIQQKHGLTFRIWSPQWKNVTLAKIEGVQHQYANLSKEP